MDITMADRRLDFEIYRTLNKVLSEPRTSLTIRFCTELKTSLQIQQEQRELEAIKTRIQASRRQVAKVSKKRWGSYKAVRSAWRRHYATRPSFPGQDENKVDESTAPACSATSSSSSSSSSSEASPQAQPAITQAIETESSGTEPGDQEYPIPHSATTEEKRHIIGNATLQAQTDIAAAPTNRRVIPTTDLQTEEADLTERRMRIDERETKIATTERALEAREASLRTREENVLGREAALLERETTLMERETAFARRNHAGV